MGKFEDNLFDDLMAAHGSTLSEAEHPPHRRPVRARAVAVAATVMIVAAGLTVGQDLVGGVPPAYAVTMNQDGTVTISINDLRAVDQANQRLRELGVRAKVVPTTKDCAPDRGESPNYSDLSAVSLTPRPGPGDSIVLPTGIPQGYTILLNFSPYPDRGTGLGFTAPRKDPVPDCVLDPADDPARSTGGR